MAACPYPDCHAPNMPMPKRRGHNIYVACQVCKRKARASFCDIADGTTQVSYSACSHGSGMVLRAHRIYPDQAKWLDTVPNASETVRIALTQYRDRMTTYNNAV